MSTMVRKALSSRRSTLRKLTERACNDPQRMRARKTEAEIVQKMPSRAWLSCTAVSRLTRAPDDRKTRARLDRLVRDGMIERKREQGTHGPVYLFRRLS
jgi:hypothetical protein